MSPEEDLKVCTACGTQYDTAMPMKSCRICDDPRQFVPPTGQSFTSLRKLTQSGKYRNNIQPDPEDENVISIWTEPKFAIGQRAFLLKTPAGNVLWDLIAYLDQETIDYIESQGGLKAIIISHPHYYTTHLIWAKAFKCPVYISREDEKWLSRADDGGVRKFIEGATEKVLEGVTAVKVGGHFDGSLVAHWGQRLFIADSLVTVPSALYHVDRPNGTASFSFMWSIPNMIPLSPLAILKILRAIKPYEFTATHGAFVGMDVKSPEVKKRILDSAKIAVKAMGWVQSEVFDEEWK